jgi:hypothetical protein
MNLKQKLPNFDTIKDLGISCDGYKVTMTILKVSIKQLFYFMYFVFLFKKLIIFIKNK